MRNVLRARVTSWRSPRRHLDDATHARAFCGAIGMDAACLQSDGCPFGNRSFSRMVGRTGGHLSAQWATSPCAKPVVGVILISPLGSGRLASITRVPRAAIWPLRSSAEPHGCEVKIYSSRVVDIAASSAQQMTSGGVGFSNRAAFA
jgi:hypothetical protein